MYVSRIKKCLPLYTKLCLVLLFGSLFSTASFAEGVDELCDCNNLNALDEAGLNQCNDIIANAFAPQVIQIQQRRDKLDKFVPLDFDGSVNSYDNWENAEQSLSSDNPWQGYYSVNWVNEAWYITYSYFYPQDWANTFFCNADEHENDLQRVVVRVERPSCNDNMSCGAIDFKSRMQIFTGHHGNLQPAGQCGGAIEFADGSGAHPVVYSATGSHAFYTNLRDGRVDPPIINICSVNREDWFHRVSPPNYESNGNEPRTLRDGNKTLDLLSTSSYQLVSVTDEEHGIWQYRNNSGVINRNDRSTVLDDTFHCTDGGGCPKHPASAPWNGYGFDPSQIDHECHAPVDTDTRWAFTSAFTGEKFERAGITGTIHDLLRNRTSALQATNVLPVGINNVDFTYQGEAISDVDYRQYFGCPAIEENGTLKFLISDQCDSHLFRANVTNSCGQFQEFFSIRKYERPVPCSISRLGKQNLKECDPNAQVNEK